MENSNHSGERNVGGIGGKFVDLGHVHVHGRAKYLCLLSRRTNRAKQSHLFVGPWRWREIRRNVEWLGQAVIESDLAEGLKSSSESKRCPN